MPPADDEIDDLDDLPAIDDGVEGPEAGAGEHDLPEDESKDSSSDPFDDETGEDDPVDPDELDDDGGETGWLEEVTALGPENYYTDPDLD